MRVAAPGVALASRTVPRVCGSISEEMMVYPSPISGPGSAKSRNGTTAVMICTSGPSMPSGAPLRIKP